MWLLLNEAYGLDNANSKWQNLSNYLLLSIGFKHAALLRQLFLMHRNRSIVGITAKIIEGVLLYGLGKLVPDIVDHINRRFTLGTVVRASGFLQYISASTCIRAPTSRSRLTAMKCLRESKVKRSLVFVVASVSPPSLQWSLVRLPLSMRRSASWASLSPPVCDQFSSRLQQRAPQATVKDYCV